MAGDHVKKIKVDEIKDIEELKKHFAEISKGMNMTS